MAEGPTDEVVIKAALQAMLVGRPFVLTQLQPEGSVAFGRPGTGWGGVYTWCKQSVRRGAGHLSGDRLLLNACDVLIVHVDADVARGRYQEANITPTPLDLPLPCEQTCPPARGSSDALRSVVLSWCGESSVPEPVVLCVPSKSTEAWVVASIFPSDSSVASTRVPFECFADPESRLAQQPKNRRFSKKTAHYEDRAKALQNAWPAIVAPNRLGEALRFQNEFLGVPAVAGSQRTE